MADLAHVLRQLPPSSDPNLLAGRHPADDAAVYRLSDDLALVQTVDFFTPIVDDPYVYGQIAAANSLSDVYAMGGTPVTALNIAAFPSKVLSTDVLSEILRGGASKAAEAGVTIVGGHTVEDAEPKYGLAVTGTVDPRKFVSAHHARAGNRLLLTKPIGSGVVATALKSGNALAGHVEQAIRWMTALNRQASRAMVAADATAATDVTGFGLLGHLLELCQASRVSATIRASAVPLLPGALEYARDDYIPAGAWTNLEFIEKQLRFDKSLDAALQVLLVDPQTSGGLLVSLPPERVLDFRKLSAPDMLCVDIGHIVAGAPAIVTVVS